jgi:hypothetical protein
VCPLTDWWYEGNRRVDNGFATAGLDDRRKLSAELSQEQVVVGATGGLAEQDGIAVRRRLNPAVQCDLIPGDIKRSRTRRHGDKTSSSQAKGLIHNASNEVNRAAGAAVLEGGRCTVSKVIFALVPRHHVGWRRRADRLAFAERSRAIKIKELGARERPVEDLHLVNQAIEGSARISGAVADSKRKGRAAQIAAQDIRRESDRAVDEELEAWAVVDHREVRPRIQRRCEAGIELLVVSSSR